MSESNSIPDWIYIFLTLLAAGISLIKSAFSKKESIESPVPIKESLDEEVEYDTIKNNNKNEDNTPNLILETEIDAHSFECEIPDSQGDEDFDIKKAIIYKEILERKYE